MVEEYMSLWNQTIRMESVATVVIDTSANIVNYNRGFLTLFALSEEQCLGSAIYELIQSPLFMERISSLLIECRPRDEFEFSYMLHSVMICWSHVEALFMKDMHCYILCFHDLTEAYQAQMILEAHLAVSDDLFFFFDQRNHVLHCSEKAANLLGFCSREEVMGMHYTTLLQGKVDPKTLESVFREVYANNGYLGYIALTKKEESHFYELSGFPVTLLGGPAGCVLLFKSLGTSVDAEVTAGSDAELVRESHETETYYDRSVFLDARQTHLYWESRECRETLEELHRAILNYEYVEINTLLERIIVFAPAMWEHDLQRIQTATMEFDYDLAQTIFEDAHFI